MKKVAYSLLFVPGDREDRFDKAASSGAHAIVLDLEDAVSAERKSIARHMITCWVSVKADAGPLQVFVRINAFDTRELDDDLRCMAQLPLHVGLMIPKAEPGSMQDFASRRLPQRPTIALVESVAGVLGLRAVASTPGLSRLAFGSVDFALDAGMTPSADESEFAAVHSALVLESRFAGLPPPIDGVAQEIGDSELVAEHARRAKRQGFGGKLCIHPMQIGAVNATFAPSKAEVEWADRVVGAFEASRGAAVALDGRMIDAPVVERARRLLASMR